MTLRYRPPGTPTYLSAPMARISGTSRSGTWEATIDASAGWSAGDLDYDVQAVDVHGKLRQHPSLIPHVTVPFCIP